jgi:hypothetical protein
MWSNHDYFRHFNTIALSGSKTGEFWSLYWRASVYVYVCVCVYVCACVCVVTSGDGLGAGGQVKTCWNWSPNVTSTTTAAHIRRSRIRRTAGTRQTRSSISSRRALPRANCSPLILARADSVILVCVTRYSATRCNTLRHTVAHSSALHHCVILVCVAHYTATHCNTLQHSATLCHPGMCCPLF